MRSRPVRPIIHSEDLVTLISRTSWQHRKENGIFFDSVITATCTGSTQAGMVVGFSAQDRKRRLIGIDTAANAAMTRAAVTKIARATAALIGASHEIRDEDIEIDPRFAEPT